MSIKSLFAAASGLLFAFTTLGQKEPNENYREIFSNNYDQAIQLLQNEKWIDTLIRSQGLNSKEVIAVVFPELIRYNSIQDKIETFALETLYVQLGKDYANFSIGPFQIKPSFAESVEKDFIKLVGTKQSQFLPDDTLQTQQSRSKRLRRLKDKTAMANYLCSYFKVMNARYPELKNDKEKIKFLASAYNCGYQKSKKEIESFLPKKFFHTGISIGSKKYCYADIAWYYFQQP